MSSVSTLRMNSVDRALTDCLVVSKRETWTCKLYDNMEIRHISLVVSTHRDESRGFLLVMYIQFSWKTEGLFLPDIVSFVSGASDTVNTLAVCKSIYHFKQDSIHITFTQNFK